MLNITEFDLDDQAICQPYWIRRCTRKSTNEQLFVEKFSLLQHYTSEILRFLSTIIKLQKIKIENFINVVGFGIEGLDIYIFYENDDLSEVNYTNLNDNEKRKLLDDVANALSVLNKYEIPHLAIKKQLIFKDKSNNYRIGFICPSLHDTIDPDDDINPLFDNHLILRDIFLYGLLSAELLYNNNRHDILERIWNLKSPLTVQDNFIERCLNLSADQRPSFNEIAHLKNTYPDEIPYNPSELFEIIKDIKPIAGSCYLTGYGTEKDEQKAKDTFMSSEDPISLNDMAKLIIETDRDLALKYLLKSTEYNFSVALKNAGALFVQDQHIKEGIHLLIRSADLGFHDAYLILADTFVRFNGNLAFKYISKAAKRGDTRALVNLGLYYEHAWGCKQDFRMMAGLWVLAAKIGSEQALNNIGVHISNRETSMKLWSNLKDPVAFFNIGNILLKRGEESREQGMMMMKSSAEAGYIPAMFNMAVLLKEENPEEADRWCTMASQAKANELVMEARMKEIASIAASSL